MQSLHTVNLHKIIFTFFFLKSFGSQEAHPALERSHVWEASQNPLIVYIPAYNDQVPHRNVKK